MPRELIHGNIFKILQINKLVILLVRPNVMALEYSPWIEENFPTGCSILTYLGFQLMRRE